MFIFFVVFVCLLLLVGVAYLLSFPVNAAMRRREEEQTNPVCDWKLYAMGGGSVSVQMKRAEAIRYCSENFGIVKFVDDDKHFIFYRPKDWVRDPIDLA